MPICAAKSVLFRRSQTPSKTRKEDRPMTHEQSGEQNSSAGQSPAAWTLQYPEECRTLLMHFGKDDRGISALRAYNEELIELSDYCRGKGHHVFEALLGWL